MGVRLRLVQRATSAGLARSLDVPNVRSVTTYTGTVNLILSATYRYLCTTEYVPTECAHTQARGMYSGYSGHTSSTYSVHSALAADNGRHEPFSRQASRTPRNITSDHHFIPQPASPGGRTNALLEPSSLIQWPRPFLTCTITWIYRETRVRRTLAPNFQVVMWLC